MVYPKRENQTPQFLREHDAEFARMVPVDQVIQFPAIYFVDSMGAVRGYWSGSLKENDQKRIVQAF